MKRSMKALVAGTTAVATLAFAGGAWAEQMKIGITQNNVGVDSYQTTYEKAFKEAAAANPDVDAVVLDAGGDVARQIAQIQDLVQQNVQAIIVWPTNGKAVVPAVKKAHDAGIPVIITNSNIAEQGMPFIAAFSGPNNIEQGKEAADMMCTGLNGKGDIVQISGKPGYTTAIERQKGFEDELAKACPDVKIMDTQPGDWNREKSQRVMEDFLVKYPQIDGVYAADDNMGVGALNAAKAAGRAKDIKFVGATNFAVGYEAMKKGEYYGSVYQSPIDDAKNALQTAIDVIQGKDVPKMNYFKTPQITEKNMDQFEKPAF
ncbi:MULTISPECIES: sugar ABC transporter substrate-binding protein [Thioclava]|uniref:Substrate-binding domain-containing protein n=1 Tax=Thioclava electrotropha TaxID=1549850 RepID=A0ABX6YTC7_9RHOB|nr:MULTISPECIES: sugar ABC transporter substrate-binding protein [Thioclava]MPQ95753.1 substrate-binding domain-containing protein [Thioclava sp. JE_KL1]QPZ91040.1 substrate-binding domain-containing protein [Thioclava electrotropha]